LVKEENQQIAASLLTPLTPDEVHDFYTTSLVQNGWQITSQSQGGGLVIMTIQKDNREAIITIGKSDVGTTISLTLPKVQ